MDKLKILILIIFVNCKVSNGQLKHYVSLGFVGYTNYFNGLEKTTKSKFYLKYIAPSISYKIEYKKNGLEVFLNQPNISYYQGFIAPANSILGIYSINIGINYQYTILQNDYIQLSPMLGIVKNNYTSHVLDSANSSPIADVIFAHFDYDKSVGFVSGINFNAKFYKQFFFTTNFRYFILPFAKFNKQHLTWEIGVGYRFQRKNKVNNISNY